MRSASGGYTVRVGVGARRQLPELVAGLAASGRCALVSDETVAGLWGESVSGLLEDAGLDVVRAAFPAGEAHKTRESWIAVTDALLQAGLGRDSCVVALGGGVVGDLAGFVAATYLRGVPFVQLPTTTLAMIDASVGGKTGVDHPLGKNLVGAFHTPAAVLADPGFLKTLGTERIAEGYAEAVKHGVIADATYARWLAENAPSLARGEGEEVHRAVVRSVQIKAEVVSGDEFEAGRRQILNFGHTVGHALEAATGYALSHGHAVAAGMVAEAAIGEALGVTAAGTAEELASLVGAFGLSAWHRLLNDPAPLVARMARDKKVRGGQIHLVLLEEIGRVRTKGGSACPVAGKDVALALGSYSPASPSHRRAAPARAVPASITP